MGKEHSLLEFFLPVCNDEPKLKYHSNSPQFGYWTGKEYQND